MIRRQTTFGERGLAVMPEGFTREDLILMKKLKRVKALCPYCLYYDDLWEFSILLKQKKGKHIISVSKCKCPDCGVGYMKRTLLRVNNMSVEEFSYWFWDGMFGKQGDVGGRWSSGDKVSWEKFKSRLRAHFAYDDRQVFWYVYWEFKDARDSGMMAEDREAFEDYKRSYEGKQ